MVNISKVSMKDSALGGSDLPNTAAREHQGKVCRKLRIQKKSFQARQIPPPTALPEAKFKASELIFAPNPSHRESFNACSFRTRAGSPARKTGYTSKYVQLQKAEMKETVLNRRCQQYC